MRRKTRKIKVGNLYIGGDAPISIQGMAKVPTSNLNGLLSEFRKMLKEGAELIRVSITNEDEAKNIKILKEKFSVPIIADIHYDYRLAIYSIENGADKVRVNPGNIPKHGLREIVNMAKEREIPIRIGINSGSIKINGPLVKSMVETAKDTVKFFQDLNFHSIIISLKTPFVKETVECYRKISEIFDYPLHLGITEAGKGFLAEAKTIAGLGILLNEGIGDTIRVSLTESSVKEIRIGKAILQSLGIRRFEPEIISCPTCGRIQVDLNGVLRKVEKEIRKLAKENPEINKLKIAVMGCPVNGPGEAKHADIGIAGGKKKFVIFRKGKIIGSYPEEIIVEKLIEEIKKILS
ncbi:MAG TPA: flavodoxin-dependent (E)-4-hydroxy-3-methylbut-2-enyl-diphosphate synthase [Firmicutes bacterium]|nr:MAG: 4-hydroxy-3-methylbut-2-en-1-yl diphosphate synthase [Candidatus Omnitrophota bacterium]HDD64554.1 flavodoxin-dependent (E)-4-hydroxy-3-methylbut-2-enyl-diphosphate synthase [Bacillota bacterium]